MTDNRSFKKAVRERAARTGEKYTTARRALLADGHDNGSADPIEAALTPGSVIAFVCGGGMTNLALVMPTLVKLRGRGHKLMCMLSERHSMALPSAGDFAVVSGAATVNEVVDAYRSDADDQVEAAIFAAAEGVTVVDGPTTFGEWVEQLQTRSSRGLAPVLWVQDIQVGGPFALGSRNDVDEISDQLAGLHDLARETGAIIALGHCMSFDMRESWQMIVDGVDETFVVDDEEQSVWGRDPTKLTLHHFRGRQKTLISRVVDHRFSSWRAELAKG